MTVKQSVQAVLSELPDDCTFEDVRERLAFIEMLRERAAQCDDPATRWLTQEQVRAHMDERIASWRSR